MTNADYTEKIPNNVALHEDRRLQRALESWQPNFLQWWGSMGPALPTQDVYLRTAINVGRDGWAQFGHVPMGDYRWGIFLAEQQHDRRVGFGQHRNVREVAASLLPGSRQVGQVEGGPTSAAPVFDVYLRDTLDDLRAAAQATP